MIGKRLLRCFLAITFLGVEWAHAQEQVWTWKGGTPGTVSWAASYGTMGVTAPSNFPGAVQSPACWIDNSGNFWMFGGFGSTTSGSVGYVNALWKRDVSTGYWTWMKGSSSLGSSTIYGSPGVPGIAFTPGGRRSSMSWKDSSGNLWLFGGANSLGKLSDLWKWDVTLKQWSYMKGPVSANQLGVYGIQGVASASNLPGARQGAVIWTDNSGNIWMFGGDGTSSSASGSLNDLWKWDGTDWTWMAGGNSVNATGVYGTQGVAAPGNQPGARQFAVGWTDASGNLWLFGGSGFGDSGGSGFLNDLWKFDVSTLQWTWMSGSTLTNEAANYGSLNVAAPTNVPGARASAVAAKDPSGNLLLFCGEGSGTWNDLWKWDLALSQWVWIGGSNTANQPGVYGTLNTTASGNQPGSRITPGYCSDNSGNLWMYGGWGYGTSTSAIRLSDIWSYNGTNWTWHGGVNQLLSMGVYGTQGVSSPSNTPGPAQTPACWVDNSGNLWMFGGYGSTTSSSIGYINALWKRDASTSEWTWLNGSSSLNAVSSYGPVGVAGGSYTPGGRGNPMYWKDSSGNLWLFGGISNDGRWNDLWKWDVSTSQWSYMGGTTLSNQLGTYGTKGVTASGNKPGGRQGAVIWTDNSGNVWMFGGDGYGTSANGPLNDLWKWDGTNWTWMSGGTLAYVAGNYGTKGVAAPTNQPGGRQNAVGWTDAAGDLWLFGGSGYASSGGSGFLNDLWKWDMATSQWIWMSGSNTTNQAGTYGTLNVPSATNVPGARAGAVAFKDPQGNLLLFCGERSGSWNDLWKWDILTSQWTWLGGGNTSNRAGSYGAQNVTSETNQPGSRMAPGYCKDDVGNLWIFGGYGYGLRGTVGRLNDLWTLRSNVTYWDGTTWTNGSPGNSSIAVIESSVAVDSDFTCQTLQILAGQTLTLNSGTTATITETFNNNGNGLAGSGTLEFNNNGGSIEILGNPISFEGDMVVTQGTTLNTNEKLVLAAISKTDYGSLTGDGTVAGKLDVQGWLDLEGTPDDGRYYYLGSPLIDAKLNDFNEPGASMISQNTSNGTAWQWNAATASWEPAGNGDLNASAVNGRGYLIYAGTNSFGTFLRNGPGTIELEGDVPTGNVTVDLAYNDGQSSSAVFAGGTGLGATEGWNLVSNPYPAQYDWDNPTVPSQLGTAKYVWNGSSFEVYNNGVGSGNRFLPPYQGFWVQLNDEPGVPVTLEFESDKRLSGQTAVLLKAASQSMVDGINLYIHGADSTHRDELFVGFDNNATTAFDSKYDARKLFNAAHMPNLYVVLGPDWYSICRVPYSGPYAFPVGLDYAVDGEQMRISADASKLSGFTSVKLEDLKENVLHDLLAGDYSFAHDAGYSNRFVLHFDGVLGDAEAEEGKSDTWVWSEGDAIRVHSDSELSRIEVFNAAGQLIAIQQGGATVSIPVLQRGVFLVLIHSRGASKTFKVVR